MNNYEKLKTICHEHYIGSEKCGQCMLGKKYAGRDSGHILNDCTACKGKGYIIPLEFGCEVIYEDRKYEYKGVNKQGANTFYDIEDFDCWSDDIYEHELENLGKPLTLQMVLWLLRKKEFYVNSAYYDNEIGVYNLNDFHQFNIDLDKDIKDQPEVLQAIIDIVK